MHDDDEAGSAAEFAQARQCLSTEANVLGEARYGRGGFDQFRAMPSRVSTAGPPSPSVAARQAHRQRNFAAHRKLGNLTISPSRKQRVQPWSRYSLQVSGASSCLTPRGFRFAICDTHWNFCHTIDCIMAVWCGFGHFCVGPWEPPWSANLPPPGVTTAYLVSHLLAVMVGVGVHGMGTDAVWGVGLYD